MKLRAASRRRASTHEMLAPQHLRSSRTLRDPSDRKTSETNRREGQRAIFDEGAGEFFRGQVDQARTRLGDPAADLRVDLVATRLRGISQTPHHLAEMQRLRIPGSLRAPRPGSGTLDFAGCRRPRRRNCPAPSIARRQGMEPRGETGPDPGISPKRSPQPDQIIRRNRVYYQNRDYKPARAWFYIRTMKNTVREDRRGNSQTDGQRQGGFRRCGGPDASCSSAA